MNKALQLLMAAALVTGFAACSSDDDMSTANNFLKMALCASMWE